MTALVLLEYATVGGCVLAAAAVVAAFAASAVGELRRVPAPAWQPAGEWYPPTPAATTAPLGALPAAVEAELAKLAAMIPDRPA